MSTNGIYGLSGSGIDVESMVKAGMLGKQNQYDKLYKKEVQNEWLKEAYAGIYSELQTFNMSTMSGYKLSSKTNPMLAASKDSTVTTATANADAAGMSHTVEVKQLASNAYMQTQSGETIDRLNTADSKSIYLKDILYNEADLADAKSKYDAMSDEAKGDTVFSFTISDGADGAAGTNNETISFTYKDIFGSNQTLNDLASRIKNSGVNITAQYDAANDSFSLYNKSGGSANQINLTVADDPSGTTDDMARLLLNSLNLGKVNTDNTIAPLGDLSATNTDMTAVGQSAIAVIDGKEYTSDTNKIAAANVTYTLAAKGTTTVTVSQDTDTLINNVKQFVTDYNKMIDELNSKYNETQYSNYGVLTKSQESKMTADQIKQWNEKAKSGLLYHDKNIASIISSMREAIYTPVSSVDSNYNTMMSIGITSSTDQGHLKLDEEKLKKALADDPDSVYQLFTSSGDVKDSDGKTTTDYSKQGVINRIYDGVNKNLSTMKGYAGTSAEASDGSTLGDLILELKTKMSNFKTLMDSYEDKLFKQYDAMEVAIQRLSVSMNYVTGSND